MSATPASIDVASSGISNASSTSAGPILWATLTTRDLDASVEAFAKGLGLRVTATGHVSKRLAMLWGAPDIVGAAWALLGQEPGALRLIEVGAGETAPPLTTPGWAAAELAVSDADATFTQAVSAGFTPVGQVRALGSNAAIRAGQVAGPEGAALYLTDVSAYDGALDLCGAAHGAGTCFIAVLASLDLEADRDWLVGQGIGQVVTDRALAVPVLQHTLGLDAAETVRISSLQLASGCLIEIDAYPQRAACRPTVSGWPTGVAMVTLRAPIAGGEAIDELPYGGRRARIDRLPCGALLERVAA